MISAVEPGLIPRSIQSASRSSTPVPPVKDFTGLRHDFLCDGSAVFFDDKGIRFRGKQGEKCIDNGLPCPGHSV